MFGTHRVIGDTLSHGFPIGSLLELNHDDGSPVKRWAGAEGKTRWVPDSDLEPITYLEEVSLEYEALISRLKSKATA